jgi:pimeloyl-ACP methyl ester carboxylesterase
MRFRLRDTYMMHTVTSAELPADSAVARTRHGPIEYRLTGTGPVVLVLKGGHSSRDTHLGHERLAEHGFTVLEPSRPGYDRTPASAGCSAQAAADALAGLLDGLGIARVRLIAISAAGHTGIELARRHPQRVDRVSFESAVALPWPATMRRGGRLLFGPVQPLIWGAVRTGLRLAPSLMLRAQLAPLTTLNAAQVVREMDPATRERYLAAYRSLWSGQGFVCDLGHDSPSTIPLGQPALILSGAYDRSVSSAHRDRLARVFPNHERVVVESETHFIWFGRAADEVWDRRLAFLA